MTSPIQQQQRPVPPARRDWCCGSLITGPHVQGCAFEPAPEPPATDPLVGSAPAASVVSEDKPYGFSKPEQFDFFTPNGDKVRLRKLRKTEVIKMRLHESFDDFGPELLSVISEQDPVQAADAEKKVVEALTQADVFDRILVAACVCPSFTLGDPDLETIEIEDKLAIFAAVMPAELQQAALEAQQEALKSVPGQAEGVRNLSDGEAVQPKAE